MLNYIVKSLVAPKVQRSPKWAALEKKVKKAHPFCSACGKTMFLQVHHILPFHLHPELELNVTNLMVLCYNCHLGLGHGGDFRYYNPHLLEDVQSLPKNADELKALKVAAKRDRVKG